MGLKTDILEAKKKALEAQNIEVRDKDFEEGSPNEIEARYMTDAFINFLTSDDLYWTVSKLRASIEVEEFNLSTPLDANVLPSVTTTAPMGVTVVTNPTTGMGSTTAPTVSNVSQGTNGVMIPAFKFKKEGTKQGGYLDARGYAYIGEDNPVLNTDTMDPESDDNRVVLYKDKIPDKLID